MKNRDYTAYLDTDRLKNNMKQRAIRGGVITSATQLVMFVLRLASIMILARLLVPEHFGLIGMVTAITVFIERFEDLGLGDAVIQRKELTHTQVSTLFWLNTSICLFIAIVVAVSGKAIAWFYKDDRLVWITVALASNFIFSGFSIQHMALIRRRMRFDHFALIRITSTALGLGAAIWLAVLGYGYWSLVWKEIVRSLTVAVLAWFFCSWRPGLPVRNSGVKSMLKFGGNVTGYNIVYYLSNNLDSILLGKYFGAVPVGLYSRARQLSTMPLNPLLDPIQYVSLPALSTLQNDPAGYRNYYEKMLSVLCFLYMPIIVYIGIYAQPIIYLALGSQWMDTIPIFRFLIFSTLVSPVVVLLGLVMVSTGQSRRYLIWGLITASSTMVAFVIGIRWGAIGLAVSWPISTGLNLIFSLFFVFKGSPVSIVSTLKTTYKPAIASLGMAAILILTYTWIATFHVIAQLTLSIFLGSIVYLAAWVLFPSGFKNIVEFASYPLAMLNKKREAARTSHD